MNRHRLVTKVEAEAIWDIVNEWWDNNDLSIFNDTKGVARRAVAEFCANQEGLTMYKHKAKTEEEKEEERKKAECHMAKWSEVSDKLQSRVTEAVEKNGQKCHVFYSAYKMDEEDLPIDNLDEIAIEGNVKFVEGGDTFFGNGKGYESDVFYNPTWLDVAVVANEMIIATGDFHHIFLEGLLRTPKEEGTKTVRFSMGS